MLSSRAPFVAWLVAATLVFIVGGAAPALARNVYLNGLKLDAGVQIKAQTFTGCDVRIDDSGDVHITAKGYKVIPTDLRAQPAAPPQTAAGGRQIWLISRETQRGVSQYDVDVFINDQFVKKIRSAEEPVVLDVTRFVSPGANRVRMIAVKNLGERRVSMSPTDTLEVLVGEGALGGSTVRVDKVLVSFKRNANETTNIREDFSFNAGKVD